jgi:hypothetical protein
VSIAPPLTSTSQANTTGKSAYYIPLTFPTGITEKEVVIQVAGVSYVVYFNLNTVELSPDYYLTNDPTLLSNVCYISCYSVDRKTVYFGSFKCVLDSYINDVDNGFPYKFFFVNNSGRTVTQVNFDTINAGVNLYCIAR